LVPGFISGLLSAIFQANSLSNIQIVLYKKNADANRSYYEQGGIQIAGLGIAIGCGIFAGLITGVLMKIVNKRQYKDQFLETNLVGEQPVKLE